MNFLIFPTQKVRYSLLPPFVKTGVFDRKQTGTQVTGGLPFTNPNRKVLTWNQFYFLNTNDQ